MKTVYLSLGSNIGDRLENLRQALKMLTLGGVKTCSVSKVYETEPVGYTDQPDFLNIAVRCETDLGPAELLKLCAGVENALLRKRIIRFGPRTIDIDILLYEGYTSDDPSLTLPHPRMFERGFVLLPLIEVAEGEELRRAKQAYALADRKGIKLFGEI